MSFADRSKGVHRQLREILEDVTVLTLRTSNFAAAKRFGEFRRLLEKHVTEEERVVLPLLVERRADGEEVSERIRIEHARLLQLIDGIASAISRWQPMRFGELLVELGASLRAHDATEDALLHLGLDDLIKSEAEWYCLCAKAGVDC